MKYGELNPLLGNKGIESILASKNALLGSLGTSGDGEKWCSEGPMVVKWGFSGNYKLKCS